MTGLDRNQTPKTRPMGHKRTALVASLDVGTSKIACMIARLRPSAANEALRGRSHAVELIGYSQIQSRGVKAGAVVDLAECEQAVRQAVALAERMAKVQVESVLLSVSGGRLQGQLVEAVADIRGGSVTADDVTRVTSTGMRHATGEGRTVLHALPVGYALDGVKGIRDPRGMVARQFGIDMNVVTADATVARNLMLVVERCHLNIEAMAASPYVAGLSVSAPPWSKWAPVPPRLQPIPAVASFTPADLLSAATTSRWIWPAASGPALQMPSESRLYTAPC
jgi:cell division protein FtsA